MFAMPRIEFARCGLVLELWREFAGAKRGARQEISDSYGDNVRGIYHFIIERLVVTSRALASYRRGRVGFCCALCF